MAINNAGRGTVMFRSATQDAFPCDRPQLVSESNWANNPACRRYTRTVARMNGATFPVCFPQLPWRG